MSRSGILRNRRFLVLWSGNGLSLIGTSGVRIAYPLIVLAISGSPALAGWVVGAVQMVTDGAVPLGAVLAGYLIAGLGPRTIGWALFLCMLVLALLGSRSPDTRRLTWSR